MNYYKSGDWIEKECSRCKQLKSRDSFSKDKQHTSGHKSACKLCAKMDWDKWRNTDIEQRRREDRVTHYKRTYKLDDDTARELVNNRIGTCPICGEIHPLVVDHCHSSGVVRGFICASCNSVLGYSKDNVHTLQKAIEYLKDVYGP